MTVRENLMIGAFYSKVWKKRHRNIRWVYNIFPELEKKKNQLARSLSGGEGQMVVIGRGLMSEPSLLILDEPSLGLAPKIVERIYQILVDLNKQGMVILLVEQNARLALQIASRAYVMETGRISLEGSAKDLAQNDYVREVYLGL
jgi:branched-chain amino acid transport system ATP-binding protein